jgi:hypothetical protein
LNKKKDYIKDGRIWVPPDEEIRRKLVELYHDSPFTGHLGSSRNYGPSRKGIPLGEMQQYIRDYVSGCQPALEQRKGTLGGMAH